MHSDESTTPQAPEGVPAIQFWPSTRAPRISLILIMAFAFFMAMLVGGTVPPWWAPDEDYHWNYASYLAEKGSIPNPNEPFYTVEWNKAIVEMNFNQFGVAPAGPTALTGDPRASTRELEELGKEERQPVGEPTRPVVHAPLYHSFVAVANKPIAEKSVFTRLTVGRAVNALFAILIVLSAWVLAAQVFTRDGPRLFVAGLAAAQPMINYSTGSMTNDAGLIAFFTLSIAALLAVVKSRPDAQQGRFAGIFITLALLTKTSALILIPIALIAFLVQYVRFRGDKDSIAEFRKSFAWLVAIPAVFAGWFFFYLIFKYKTVTGAVGPINPVVTDESGQVVSRSLTEVPGFALEWMRRTYSTYWSHYVYWEGPRGSMVFYVPMIIGLTGIAGLAAWVARKLRAGASRSPLFLQVVFLLGVSLLVVFPWFVADMMRSLNGHGMAFNGGRFILPAYPAVAVLFTLGISELLKRRVQLAAFSLIAIVASWVGVYMWKLKTLDRYFGGEGVTSFGQELQRASFFRAEWVTQNFLWAMIVLAGISATGAWVSGVIAARRDGPPTGPL